MKKPHIALLFVVALFTAGLTSGCAMFKEPGPSPEALNAIMAAKTANKKAKSVGYEWRDTGKFIKKAQAAADKGDNAKAIKLANKAKTQAELAVKQSKYEATLDRSVK
jgi:hypothetical protein